MTVKARKHESTEERVTPLELFFDLIFVFAITQVTGLIVADPWHPGTSPSATPCTGSAQLTMARDSYSYLHLPMVAGIILFAVGAKKTLVDVGEPLKLVPAVALCGGIALYLVAHVLFRLRNVRSLNRQRVVVAGLLLALLPAAVELPALATLGAVAALCVGLIAYEAIRYAEARNRVRHAPDPAG